MKNLLIKQLFCFFVLSFLFTSKLVAANAALVGYIDKFSDKMAQRNSLSFTTSYDFGCNDIREISLFFSSNKPLTVDESRNLVLRLTKEFLEGINSHASIKPDLNPYPFTAKQLDITIFFRGSNGKYAKMPKVAQVSLSKGVLSFYKYQQNTFQVIKQEDICKLLKKEVSDSSFDQILLDELSEALNGWE